MAKKLDPAEVMTKARYDDDLASALEGAVMLVGAGVVQERLGHATIAITLDTYSHAIPAMQRTRRPRLRRYSELGLQFGLQ